MQFITTGNRIAVENFTIGDLYTITFTNGNYINSACIGIGANFVTFQRNEPELLFSLTMETAELVSTIDLYAGGSGTNNYNELTNKPQINSVELVGNKSLAALGIQPEITEESPLSSELVSGLGSAAAAETSDFATAAQGALAASAVQPATMDAALALKQDALSSAQLAAVNSGITSADVAQITTNKNNILKIHNPADVYFSETAPTGTITLQSYWISSTGVHVYGDNVYGASIEQGSFETFSGAEITANNRVRTTFDSQAPTGTYTVSAEGADDVVIYAYTSNSTSSWSSADSVTAWQPLPYTFTTAQNLYLRFAFRHNNNSTIAPSDVSNVKVIAHKWTE